MFRRLRALGQKDPQFHMDVSFFAFRLPFWRYLLGFGFAIVLLSLVVTLAVDYLRGGRRSTPGNVNAGRSGASFEYLVSSCCSRPSPARSTGSLVLDRAARRRHSVVGHRWHLHRRQGHPTPKNILLAVAR